MQSITQAAGSRYRLIADEEVEILGSALRVQMAGGPAPPVEERWLVCDGRDVGSREPPAGSRQIRCCDCGRKDGRMASRCQRSLGENQISGCVSHIPSEASRKASDIPNLEKPVPLREQTLAIVRCVVMDAFENRASSRPC